MKRRSRKIEKERKKEKKKRRTTGEGRERKRKGNEELSPSWSADASFWGSLKSRSFIKYFSPLKINQIFSENPFGVSKF